MAIPYLLLVLCHYCLLANGFVIPTARISSSSASSAASAASTAAERTCLSSCVDDNHDDGVGELSSTSPSSCSSRRGFFLSIGSSAVAAAAAMTTAAAVAATTKVEAANAAVGTLPEFDDTNAILQGITVRVADKSQQDAMIKFLSDSFDCEVRRKRIRGSVEETWLGFGPEQLGVPDDFTLPVSSFSQYGGHASIHVVCDTKSAAPPLYRIGENSKAPGDNIAYVQLGVPTYRVSQMVGNGGNVLDAYGIVNVVSPSGLPFRGIVGIWPDPIMFVAINCNDVGASASFYERLGFAEREYPYARPNKGMGQFEPPQPPKSVYMSPSSNCMGVLLLPTARKNSRITPNQVVQSLNIVYAPPPSSSSDNNDVEDEEQQQQQQQQQASSLIYDPSGVPIRFQSVPDFEAEERITR